ncbi:MAG TPA: hypothetical protein VFT38_18670 [Vicinamibacteria bacterium]|nr:hypothetical protein [Vicinamibacteria bacterium]
MADAVDHGLVVSQGRPHSERGQLGVLAGHAAGDRPRVGDVARGRMVSNVSP